MEEVKAIQLKLNHAEEALKNTQSSAPNLERQIAEKNALKSTLAEVRYERDVFGEYVKRDEKESWSILDGNATNLASS